MVSHLLCLLLWSNICFFQSLKEGQRVEVDAENLLVLGNHLTLYPSDSTIFVKRLIDSALFHQLGAALMTKSLVVLIVEKKGQVELLGVEVTVSYWGGAHRRGEIHSCNHG